MSVAETSRPSAVGARPPVVVVSGPTCAGKTALAIELALRFEAEIICADSVQVYRFMDIGAAKPSAEQRAQVPHHMLDVVNPDVVYNAGRYAAEARAVAADVHARGRAVVLAGGTGLYVRAFLDGLLGTGAANLELRERLEREHRAALEADEPDRLHRRLRELDPGAAARIHPRDLRRIVRALEIIDETGGAASDLRSRHDFADRPYRRLHLAIDPGREALDRRIDQRCEQMLESGLLGEVRQLRDRGYGPELRSMQAIGYRHMAPVVAGSDTLVNALDAMQRDTRRFARRQRTWLRGVPSAVWLRPDDADQIFKLVETFLREADRDG
jgi:tRNA dimethylallyltransferase